MQTQTLNPVKDVICQIIAAAGGRLEGKLRLYKAFYYAHLFYWKRGRGVLTQHSIVRMPLGPGIDQSAAILLELQKDKMVRVTTRPLGPYQENVYELAGRFEIDPSDPRYQAIEEAVAFVCGKSAVELSEETHVYSRSWRQAKDGDVLDIYSDLLEDDDYQWFQQHDRKLVKRVNQLIEDILRTPFEGIGKPEPLIMAKNILSA